MHITFGLFLDTRQGPSPTNFFNTPIVGRLGFLSLLETYLGLSAPEASKARRVTIYSGLLRVHDNNSRFYSESLKADSIGRRQRYRCVARPTPPLYAGAEQHQLLKLVGPRCPAP